MEMGKEIRRLRNDRGLTQEALAAALNVTAQTVSKWECGNSIPDVQMLPEIAVYFGVTIDQLFAMTPEQQIERIENHIYSSGLFSEAEQRQIEQQLLAIAEDPAYAGKAHLTLAEDEEHPLKPYNCTEKRNIIFFNPDGAEDQPFQFSGRLTGGCLDILVNLCGTKYDKAAAFAEKYRKDGIIWFLEACDLNVFSIRRAVWELQHAGWFEHVKGFLFGRPYSAMDPLMGLDHIHAVTDLLSSLHVPILLDADLGHLPPMIPLISGSLATVSANPADGSMQISMKCK